MQTREFVIDGMTCGHCVQAVTNEVQSVAGVTEVAVELDGGRLIVTGDSIDEGAIAAAVDEAGYRLVG